MSDPGTNERRRFQRMRVGYRLDVRNTDGPQSGYLIDISLGGVQVRHPAEEDFAKVRRLRIDFPRWLGLGDGVDVPGNVVWVGRMDERMSECGYCFSDLPQEKLDLLGTLIGRLEQALREDGLSPNEAQKPELDDEISLSAFF